MTIKDIARLAGCGVATVSRVLNGQPDVSPRTRERVLAVVAEHDFRPNSNARRLKQRADTAVPVLVQGTQNMLFAGLVEQVQAHLRDHGRQAALYYLDEDGGLMPQEVTLDLYEGDTQVGAVVKALLARPEDRDLISALPEGFQVTAVRLEESTCYVDLPSAALAELPEDANLPLALRALAESLLSLRSVEEVRYLVDGEFASVYGTASVLEPYTARN